MTMKKNNLHPLDIIDKLETARIGTASMPDPLVQIAHTHICDVITALRCKEENTLSQPE